MQYVVGGAIYLVHGTLLLGKLTLFLYNRAGTDGGALFSVSADITLQGTVQFNYNSANNGGAMYFQQTAGMIFASSSELFTAYNNAREYGGVIFNEDVPSPVQCSYIPENSTDALLPYCFFRPKNNDQSQFRMYTSNDSAGKDGDFLYGGLLDRCQQIHYLPYKWLMNRLFHGEIETARLITSQPYQLCLCESVLDYNCLGRQTAHIYRGQKLRLSVLALDQTPALVSTTIKALKSSNARIESNQNPQMLPQECSTLSYNLFSTQSREQLILYPDGPCQESELARVVVDVMLQPPCPDAFIESGDHCVCEERLQEYASCIIGDDIYIIKKFGLKILDEHYL